ncbi:MAG: hypothetical protein H6577_04805 [Lewinellaceae bacterium]|nr:hypothetical protein [Saprospiraceae bacterium]MCB9337423.1 hypothetical protein [Lewinellaceae bacterium]
MKQERTVQEESVQNQIEPFGAKPMTEEQDKQATILHKKSFYKEKYRVGLKSLLKLKMKKIIGENPNAPLTEVLSDLVKRLSPEIPPEILTEMTLFIIAEWEKMTHAEPTAV